eukprot:gnl/MRDRNA2_/MRDRNA2_22010_c0_seq1.p1 gnl/MRDRNA2_/MRDRNA2_22010_c0~~gnl/MRDRNA2_/MRDRNA2_22010_c0_seq1.p1  ORF type:complete len:405 (-),score=79.79 gnl/MRDRNA2_/MRDRNA2_22010_c0_seq1:35-1168(-)
MAVLQPAMRTLNARSMLMQPIHHMSRGAVATSAGGLRHTALPGSTPIKPQVFASDWLSGFDHMLGQESQVSGDVQKEEQLKKMTRGSGLISALDESDVTESKTQKERADLLGRMLDSTHAQGLKAPFAWVNGTGDMKMGNVSLGKFPDMGYNEAMSALHDLRAKIFTSPSYTGDKILGAILSEDTINRKVDGIPTAEYLWDKKKVVPFMRSDVGVAEAVDGVQMMKDNPGLEAMLDRGLAKGIWGTKQRSQIRSANPAGIKALVKQQFEVGKRTIAKGMVPILQPEVDSYAPDKEEIEDLLLPELMAGLAKLEGDQKVMLKLTLPEKPNLYLPLMEYPQVVRVVALMGGYNLDESLIKLAQNDRMIGSLNLAQLQGR